MAFYIGEMKKVRNSFFEAYKDGDYKKAIVLGNKLLQIYAENDDCDCIEYACSYIRRRRNITSRRRS